MNYQNILQNILKEGRDLPCKVGDVFIHNNGITNVFYFTHYYINEIVDESISMSEIIYTRTKMNRSYVYLRNMDISLYSRFFETHNKTSLDQVFKLRKMIIIDPKEDTEQSIHQLFEKYTKLEYDENIELPLIQG